MSNEPIPEAVQFKELLQKCVNASFDCGEWGHDDSDGNAPDYNALLAVSQKAKIELLEYFSSACQDYAKRVNAEFENHIILRDQLQQQLEKAEKYLAEHKLSVQMAEDNYAKLQQLREDVKPLLIGIKDCHFAAGCMSWPDREAFLTAHPEFRKDETK